MTSIKFDNMNLDELRKYVLNHREDKKAFYTYIDRSKADGRMIAVDYLDDKWEKEIEKTFKKT
ncbi:DUF6887 family protein [Geminocystis sp. GBBB08]|uniref:DUF6887 family protein n=1 Tax=Geminocystis sp. GBBB08 TaxID=2604140 RepID=UPI0027E345CA|nr:hypothetical protein [Geminocystis sp. GBBB08]MBL1209956.1 hypothetical protein [Geminocystis sp. GBBB08]